MAGSDCTRTCTIDGCLAPLRARGMCATHWSRWKRHGDPLIGARRFLPSVCCVDWCDRKPRARIRGVGDGYCAMHYLQVHQLGELLPQPVTMDPSRDCEIDGCAGRVRSPGASWCEKHYARNRRHGTPLAEVRELVRHERCAQCGAESHGRKYCSMACSSRGLRAEAMAANPVEQKAMFIAQYHRRRARMRGAYVENVNPIEVMARDKWVCHLCRERIPKSAKYPNPMSASIDHVIPLAAGGMHSYANIKAAHLGCNCRKGAKVKGQLGLPFAA